MLVSYCHRKLANQSTLVLSRRRVVLEDMLYFLFFENLDAIHELLNKTRVD